MTKSTDIEPIEKATGKPWDEWLGYLNSIDAKDLSHKDIAAKLYLELADKMDKAGWWAQNITVAYEQQIGRRIPGQSSDGTFATSTSKSTKLGMRQLMDKWIAFSSTDNEVQNLISSEPRTSGTVNRLNWRAKSSTGQTIIATSEPKKDASTASLIITIQNNRSIEENEESKKTWASIIERFTGLL